MNNILVNSLIGGMIVLLSCSVGAADSHDELTEEELAIIAQLDFFENFEIIEEDLTNLENYEDVQEINLLGDDDE